MKGTIGAVAARALLAPALALPLMLSSSCASTGDERDPLEPVNRVFQVVNGVIDGMVLQPLTATYVFFLPATIRGGVSNVIGNATYLDTVLNDLLQGKFEQGGRDMARFLVNSTAGVAGVIDVASGLGLEEHDEDFGQTLASWGVPAGSYIVVPLFGPSTLRDLPGLAVSYFTSPVPYVDDGGARAAMWSFWFVDRRAAVDPDFERRAREAPDPYTFVREAWLRHREFQATDGATSEGEEEAGELLDEIDELDELDELDALDEASD